MPDKRDFFGDEVRRRRRELNLTQSDLGARCSPPLSQTTIADIERHRNSSSRYLVQLSRALGCEPDDLVTPQFRKTPNIELGSPRNSTDLLSDTALPLLHRVPVIPWARAEWWERAVQVSQEQVWTTAEVGPRSFALVVAGDAMAGAIPDGAAVIVDPDGRSEHRSIVLAQRPGEAPLLRRLWFDGGVPQLRAENPAYPLLSFPDGSRIIGVAVSYTVHL